MYVIVELRILDGLDWIAEYTYIIDGYKWKDQKRFIAIFKRGGISYQSKGLDKRYPPLLLR